MSSYNPFNRQNENALSDFPLVGNIETKDFIVDANFVQFDNFVPVLNYATIDTTGITLNITFDFGVLTTQPLLKVVYNEDAVYRSLRLYTPDNSRYLGTVVFGSGVLALWENSIGRKIICNVSFDPGTVRSIPSNDAVYSLDTSFGDVVLGRSASDKTIFYNTATTGGRNAVTFNAVSNHAPPEMPPAVLRKINLVTPKNNNINLTSNDIIKINSFNAASLTVSLVSGALSKPYLIPTVIV